MSESKPKFWRNNKTLIIGIFALIYVTITPIAYTYICGDIKINTTAPKQYALFVSDSTEIDSLINTSIDNDKIKSIISDRIQIEKKLNESKRQIEALNKSIEYNKAYNDTFGKWFGILIAIIGLFGLIVGIFSALSINIQYKDKKENIDEKMRTLEKDIEGFKNGNVKQFKKDIRTELKTLQEKTEKEFIEGTEKKIEEIRKKAEEDSSKIMNNLQKETEDKFSNNLKSIRLHTLYQNGVSFFNKAKYKDAIAVLMIVLKSKYLLNHTFVYLGDCYMELYKQQRTDEDYHNALKYLEEALEHNRAIKSREKVINSKIEELKNLRKDNN